MEPVEGLQRRFAARFGGAATVYRAPGRVNLIGEHTDYNDGFVMPVAIDRGTWVAIAPRQDGKLVLHSETFNETTEDDLTAGPLQPRRHWSDYVRGVVAQALAAGHQIGGANLLITSTLPTGAGLSSSAAVEVAAGHALLDTSEGRVDRLALAQMCQRAENEFVGARCGIMDQFAATHGRADHALMLDCRSLEHATLLLPSRIRLVVVNTMVKHSIAAGEYNVRRAECEGAVRALSTAMPHIRALRDVTPADLEQHGEALSPVQQRRARHVVTENARVRDAAAALVKGDLNALGILMAASHRSLRDDFQVSCPELDTAVAIAGACDGVYGTRMTGGGFGGSTINLVAVPAIEAFVQTMRAEYERRIGITPEIHVCAAADGSARC